MDIPIDDLRAQLKGELITRAIPTTTTRDRCSSRASTSGRSRSRGSPAPMTSQRSSIWRARAAWSSPSAAAATAARGTGPSTAASSSTSPRMDGVEIDADDRTAWVETGATAGGLHARHRREGARDRIRRQRLGWHRRDHARGRDRVPRAEDRPDDRQPIGGRGGDRRRRGRSRRARTPSLTSSGRSAAARATSASPPGFSCA